MATPDPLARYNAKRDFTRTKEPAGEPAGRRAKTGKRLRYVIQKHDATRLHYDFRLELDGVLKSWAVPKGPSLDPHDKRLAVHVEDHPMEYGNFEGTIPEGEYGGGTVQLWDRGTWAPEDDPQYGLKKGHLRFKLDGKRLQGTWDLIRLRSRNGEKRENWLLIKADDDEARPGKGDALTKLDESVKTGRSMAEIAKGKAVWHSNRPAKAKQNAWLYEDKKEKPKQRRKVQRAGLKRTRQKLPEFIPFQLASLVEQPPGTANWVHEIKLDGYRLQLRNVDGEITVRSRKGLDWTGRFPGLAVAMERYEGAIIDGEAVVLDENGISDFSGLQAALENEQPGKVVYFAFDALFADGEDLRELPLTERKERLKGLLRGDRRLRYVDHVKQPGPAVLESACRMKLEGIISKKADAAYASGRGHAWLKSKCRGREEFVIGGYTHGKSGAGLGAVLLGVFRDGRLRYAGRAGSGLGATAIKLLLPRLKPLKRVKSPFVGTQPDHVADVVWVEPKLIAEVAFAGWTGDGLLRQASYLGLRDDKDVSEVVGDQAIKTSKATPRKTASRKAGSRSRKAPGREPARDGTSRGSGSPVVAGVALSHPDKVLWSDAGVTKKDLADYYERASDRLLPFLVNRPLSIIRAPDGIDKETFFQRHAGLGTSSLIKPAKVPGEKKPYLMVDDLPGLIALAQISAVELHPWGATMDDIDRPDQLTFDLDPAPDVTFDVVVAAAKELRTRIEGIGFAAFPKLTGGKGVHVVMPLRPSARWPEAKAFARTLCMAMADDSPDRFTMTMAKKARGGKIFLDYLRNDKTATAVTAWSPRARPKATVAIPLSWAALKKGIDPADYTIGTVGRLLTRADPWADFDRARRKLSAETLNKAA